MSKPVKELVTRELVKRFEGINSLAVIGFMGIGGVETNKIRGRLRDKSIKVSVVKNSLARKAFGQLGLKGAEDLLDGPSAVAFSVDPDNVGVVEIIRELLDIGKETPGLQVKAALLEGQKFGPGRIQELSAYPTRDEAIAKAVTCILSPGGNLSACLVGPGRKLASLVKAIQERAEKAETDQAA
jgi:ribosomal protein L10